MLASKHFTPIVGVDIHATSAPPFNMFQPFIGLVVDPGEYLPFIGCNTYVNGKLRGGSSTSGRILTIIHIPIATGPFVKMPNIGHDSINFFGGFNTFSEGCRFTAAPLPIMTCNDAGIVLSGRPGKDAYWPPVPTPYATTSLTIPLPLGAPVNVGGPYIPDLLAMARNLVLGYGFGCIFKFAGRRIANFNINHLANSSSKWTQKLSSFLCRLGFEPVNLITGAVEYEGTDFELPGPIPLVWKRNWMSDSLWQGPLGHGCHWNYDMRLERFSEYGGIVVTLPDGRPATFRDITPGESDMNRREKLNLSHNGDHYEVFSYESRLTYHFPIKKDQREYFLSVLENEAGHSIKINYIDGKVKEIIDSAGRRIVVSTDKEGRIIKAELVKDTHTKELLVAYEYNEEGDMSGITDALNQTTRIVYRNHLMISKTDRNGQTFYWEYDGNKPKSKCIHTWGDGGLLEGWIEYKKGYNLVTDSLGNTSRYEFTPEGFVTTEIDPLGAIRQTDYTADGHISREIDCEGNITGYEYNEMGLLTRKLYPDGSSYKYRYDEKGRMVSETTSAGAVSIYIYDENGLHLKTIAPDNQITSFHYNEYNLVAEIDAGSGRQISLNYDDQFNITEAILPDGIRSAWSYDYRGQVLESRNATGERSRYCYDLLGRVIKSVNPDGNVINLFYDAYNDIIAANDKERKVEFEYTPLGSLKKRIQNGKALHFVYNNAEQLISLRNEGGERYTFERDKAGRIIKETGFDGLTRQYQRSPNGWVKHMDRPGNRYADYVYDNMGQLCGVEYHDFTFEQYAYDKNGFLIEARNNNSCIKFTRDKQGRILEEWQDGHLVKSNYNKEGRRSQITSSLGANLSVCYTSGGLLKKMNAGSWEMELFHNHSGQEIERILSGGVISRNEYDKAGRVKRHMVNSRGHSTRQMRYEWGINDRLMGIINELSNKSTWFDYDTLGNLTGATYNNTDQLFRIPDSIGNLYQTQGKKDRKYGLSGRLLETDSATYHYDEEGNIAAKVVNWNDVWQYQWNANGSLKEVIRPDKQKVKFEYDALGRRTAKIYAGRITRWIWDGNTPLHEWSYELKDRPIDIKDPSGFIYKDTEEPVANLITWVFEEGSFHPAAKLTENGNYSIITDYLGTPCQMYDNSGDKVWEMELDIYGKLRTFEGRSVVDCPFRYQGQYEDIETGLYYNRFRYYVPEEGIYLSQDPIGLESNNPTLYGYVQDVNSCVDEFGLKCTHKALNPKQLWASIKDKWGKRMSPNEMREIQKTIDRIKTNKPKYSNDGTRFNNDHSIGNPNSQRLNSSNTYTEWTVKSPGVGGNGSQRIVVNNQTGQAYYTNNHYDDFIEIDMSGWK